MGITSLDNDFWGSQLEFLPCGLYFYYINKDIEGFDEFKDYEYLGNCPSIQSIQYVPFLKTSELDLYKFPYDVERFGSIDKNRPNLPKTPSVYRMTELTQNIRELGKFKTYDVDKSNVGKVKSWKNESRLYNYPYAFAMLTDHLNPPMEIKYDLCIGNESKVKVRNTISDRCSYGLFIDNYKGDMNGKMESYVSGDAHELPSSSSAYNQWYANNKNQMANSVRTASQNSFLTKETSSKMLKPNMLGTLSGTSLNPMSILGSGANMYGQIISNNQTHKRANLDIQQAVQNNLATGEDMKSTPNTMISMGSDVYYGLNKGEKILQLYRYGLHPQMLEKLGDYFAMFGYKQNKVMKINTRDRYHYNYIKTVGINLSAEYIPRNHLEQLKEIFDNGVTIWHIGRQGVKVGDYSKDNYEVAT